MGIINRLVERSLTQCFALVPIAISDFDVIRATVVALEDIERRDVENYTFAVSSGYSPFATFTVGRWRIVEMYRGAETSTVFLEGPAAFW